MKFARFPVASLVAGLALTAAAVSAPLPASAAPHASRAARAEVTLTNRDHERSVAVERGELITVRLTGSRTEQATWRWEVPVAADGRVLVRTDTGTFENGDAWAAFRAEKDGTTTVDSTERCAPNPGFVCPGAVMDWRATVSVR
ncbi:hypothetical protein [Streptomyces sp. NPDC002537]